MTAIAVAAVLFGAALQSATGFGFALVAAPLLVATLDAQPAVSVAALISIEVNAMTLLVERHAPSALRDESVRLLMWGLPGLAAGAALLSVMSDHAVALLVAGGVLAGLFARLHARRGSAPEPRPRTRLHTGVAGLMAGTLTTSTGLNGPPLVLYLAGSHAEPAQVRETLAAVLGTLGVLGVAALALAGSFSVPGALPLLLVAGVIGQLLGRRAFRFLDGDRYERVVTLVLGVTAVLAAVAAFA